MISKFACSRTFGFSTNTVVAPSFSAESLFTSPVVTKQGAIYDPSDLTTLWQDAAGTVPVTKSGDPVGLMLDKSGNGNHAVQTVSSARPTYQTDGILHSLKFDGVDDFIESTNLVNYNGKPLYLASALKFNNSAILSGVFRFKDDAAAETLTDANFLEEYGSTFKILVQRRPTSVVITTTDQSYTTAPCVSWLTNGATLKHQVMPNNSILDAGYKALASGVARLGIGVGYKGSKLNGHFYGFIWVSEDITDAARDSANAYLAAKAGVTL